MVEEGWGGVDRFCSDLLLCKAEATNYTLDDAVAATLEMESYLSPQAVRSTFQEPGEPAPASVDAVSNWYMLLGG